MGDEIFVKLLKDENKQKSAKPCPGKCSKYILICAISFALFATIFIWYFCDDISCSTFSSIRQKSIRYEETLKFLHALKNKPIKSDIPHNEQFDFNIKGTDVIVFLHIQNTGGNVFARHMVEDLALERPCVCRRNRRHCKCYRPNRPGSSWLFSRYTMGWKCGVHPDWTQLSHCVDQVMDEDEGRPVKRRYFFITLLRDPLKRFLSEYWHSRQQQQPLLRSPTPGSWCGTPPSTCHNQTLPDFLNCPGNLALNRQVRMLADLTLTGCDQSTNNLVLLSSAKNNLHKMAFFGLAEFPKISRYMFEATFRLAFLQDQEFSAPPSQRSLLLRAQRKQVLDHLSPQELNRTQEANRLDTELYQYAKKLFFYRFDKLKKMDPEFDSNFELATQNNLTDIDWAETLADFFYEENGMK
ncbi:HS6ST1 [Cordylochernes scorpioides]|uniref:Heparan-sulfate 6-O-sulfotransferase n=1 Tax=Cordylochernes scorpioides TaxID=51811 RepID=A0ABY6KR64_9ARAC|nr:HS6ST1 [Cordylochernes scorpioides]